MANLKEVRQKITKWVETNIGPGEDYKRAPITGQPVSPNLPVSGEVSSPRNPLELLEGVAVGDIEVPDLPSPPAPGDTLSDFGKGFASDTAQSFIISIFTNVLKHVIDSPTAPAKPRKVKSPKVKTSKKK